MLAAVVEGRGASRLVHGSAGVGKTALLRQFADEARARNFRVLFAAGVETERWFPFAALHLLLQPLVRSAGELPEALRAAFGATQAHPDVARVALAALELVADAAERQPVLLIVDDLQWLDSSSRDVVGFIARRTREHPILIVCAARTEHSGWRCADDHPELLLGPLGPPEAAELLDSGRPGLAPPVRRLILDRAAGNPLALVELPKVLRSVPEDPADLPLTQRLEAAFADRTAAVSPACRALLLLLAAEPVAPVDVLLTATAGLVGAEISKDVVRESFEAGLTDGDRAGLQFRHPLMRSAIYQRATVAERLAAHRELAAALAGQPERRLIHEVAAALGPDDGLADRLERVADDAYGKNRGPAAVTALRQAARLTGSAPRRTALLLRAAELSAELNDHAQTRALLDRADLTALGPVERARLLNVAEIALFATDDPDRRVHELVAAVAAARQAGAADVALNLLWRAAARCFYQDAGPSARAAVAAELHRSEFDPDDPHTLAVWSYADPYGHGADVLARLPSDPPDEGRSLHLLGSAALCLGEFSVSSRLMAAAAAAWRVQGRLGMLARALAGAWPTATIGEIDRARTEAEEACALAEETGSVIALLAAKATAAMVAVLRGDTGQAAERVRDLRAHPQFPGMRGFAVMLAAQVDGLAAMIEGRPAEAFALLARIFDPADPHHHSVLQWAVVPDLADAAVAAGLEEQAREILAGLPDQARRLPSEMMVTSAAYARAALGPDENGESTYAEALRTVPAEWPLLRARLTLQYGRWLRRRRRYVDARTPLRSARDECDRLGARPWADEAHSQLQATGEASSRRSHAAQDRLSAQELQVAMLAAQGLSNREIGRRLFISHRTVGSHLSHVFHRLGINGRGQLASALDRN